MPHPLTQEADLRDQRLQRFGGQAVGVAVGGLGLAGVGAWASAATGTLPDTAVLPPVGLILGGMALVAWSRGILVQPDPALPNHAALPDADPRRAQPVGLRRARWMWAAAGWCLWMALWSVGAWCSQAWAPGWARLVVYLVMTMTFTLRGARWLEAANGESSYPLR